MFRGDFEIHLTGADRQADDLATFAQRRGVKFSHIVLSRGDTQFQPMLTITGSGTLDEMRELAVRWRAEMTNAALRVDRVKIEAAPWNEGVPGTDDEAAADRYFEHHVKVLRGSDFRDLLTLLEAVEGHHAHVSRNARRVRADGHEERFVTQRCHGVGRETARARLDAMLAALSAAGVEVLEVEEEYVVHDDALTLDNGWLEAAVRHRPDDRVAREPGRYFPPTYLPLRGGEGVRQLAVFDPALKQFARAFRAGEPAFTDPAAGERWLAARRAAMAHVLSVVAATPWAENLVLRGSVVLRAWLGDAAREPGDLDFVVTPTSFAADGDEATAMVTGLVAAVTADPGPGLRGDQVVSSRIWTYDRVPGRRLMVPFDVAGLPQGAVQLDLVFNEHLPEPPTTVAIPPLGTRMRTATPLLSLAWKLEWLMADMYPQGKDLYDAVLLAEYVRAPMADVVPLMRPELGRTLAEFVERDLLALDVDWQDFRDEYPAVTDDSGPWLRRLADVLTSGD
ncbi:nucleotidyl transferase AbiEii/AbiGii toxin family protein [Actinophytocola sp. NPDC049390]|uniref:nucleotidyl transferase AbiEii/AbiGii toxin family protein n=1 Tax=Actinophytocola sp. NPDC049390 TaxID=3363894 RepID=UPI0037AA5B8A